MHSVGGHDSREDATSVMDLMHMQLKEDKRKEPRKSTWWRQKQTETYLHLSQHFCVQYEFSDCLYMLCDHLSVCSGFQISVEGYWLIFLSPIYRAIQNVPSTGRHFTIDQQYEKCYNILNETHNIKNFCFYVSKIFISFLLHVLI